MKTKKYEYYVVCKAVGRDDIDYDFAMYSTRPEPLNSIEKVENMRLEFKKKKNAKNVIITNFILLRSYTK